MIADLFLLGGLDVVTGIFLMSMRTTIFKAVSFSLAPEIVFLLGIAIIVKGIYSIAYGAIAKG